MSETKFREGSMGAADQKTIKSFKIGMVIATVIAIILLWTVPLLKAEAAQTGGFFKVLSWIAFIASLLIVAFQDKITNATKNETLFYVFWFISFGLGFFLRICGGI